jgi:hypothetical protein
LLFIFYFDTLISNPCNEWDSEIWNSNILLFLVGLGGLVIILDGRWDNLFFAPRFFLHFFCFEVSLKERDRFRNVSYNGGQVFEGDSR